MPNLHLWQTNVPNETFTLYCKTSMWYPVVIKLATRCLSITMAQELISVFRTASNSETLLERLRISGSRYQHSNLHHWTWYSNMGNSAKEIDHIPVSTHQRIFQNCSVHRSTEFYGTDHRPGGINWLQRLDGATSLLWPLQGVSSKQIEGRSIYTEGHQNNLCHSLMCKAWTLFRWNKDSSSGVLLRRQKAISQKMTFVLLTKP